MIVNMLQFSIHHFQHVNFLHRSAAMKVRYNYKPGKTSPIKILLIYFECGKYFRKYLLTLSPYLSI
jgi:hypothetical protein